MSRDLASAEMAAKGWCREKCAAEWYARFAVSGGADVLTSEAFRSVGTLRRFARQPGGARRVRAMLGEPAVWFREDLGQYVGWGWIVPARKGVWRPPAGEPEREPPEEPGALGALLLPVLDGDGFAIELLALDPADPARWWRRTGAVDWLGHDLDMAEAGASRRLYRHPLDWLKAGGLAWPRRGCALDLRAVLQRHGGEIAWVCDDSAHARNVKRRRDALLRPALPDVSVMPGAGVERNEENREAA